VAIIHSNIKITKLSQSVIYWYMYIISQPEIKVKLQFVQQNGAHGLRRRSSSLLEEPGTERARTNQLAPRNRLDLRWRAPLQSTPQNLNMQVQGSQKLPNKYAGKSQVSCRDKYMHELI